MCGDVESPYCSSATREHPAEQHPQQTADSQHFRIRCEARDKLRIHQRGADPAQIYRFRASSCRVNGAGDCPRSHMHMHHIQTFQSLRALQIQTNTDVFAHAVCGQLETELT